MPSFSGLFYYLTFITVSLTGKALAQAPTPIPFPLPNENFSLSGFATYTLSERNITDFKILSSLPFVPLHHSTTGSISKFSDTVESAWTCFVVKNTLAVDTTVMLKLGSQARRVILYEQQSHLLKETGRAGTAMPLTQLSEKDSRRIKILLKANRIQCFFLRQQRHGLSNGLDTPALQTQTQAIIERSKAENDLLPLRNFTLMMVGFQFAVFLFSFIKYNNQQHDKAYLWYGLFNSFSCIFALAEHNAITFRHCFMEQPEPGRLLSVF